MPTLSYVVISPVKDEAPYIGATLDSICAQTIRPLRWIIVDDGSSDATAEIVDLRARQCEWITLVRRPRSGMRGAGSPVVAAFNLGLELVRDEKFDLIVKLDGDLQIPPAYFERLLRRFEEDPRLGIASGVYCERKETGWEPVDMPDYHAAGASKAIRRRCFEEIGGFVASRGWDTVDEIRAQTHGWRTRHFPDLTFQHLRAEGSARGPLYTSRLHGEVYYLTGGSLPFFLIKALHRMISTKPLFLGGIMLLAGYLRPLVQRRPRLVSPSEAKHYRRTLNRRVTSIFTGMARSSREG